MSNRRKIYGKGRIEGRFVGYREEISSSLAWKHMSYGARLLYLALLNQVSFKRWNNGRVYLATRKAAETIGAGHRSTWGWFKELEHYGFIAMTTPGTIGPHGKAAHWRITDIGWGELDGKPIRPTKDYLEWDGVLFDPKSQKQKIAAKNASTSSKKRNIGKPQDTRPYVAKNATYAQPPNAAKNATYLEVPSPPTVTGNAGPGVGHNQGPPLAAEDQAPKLEWSTPQITEVFGAERDEILREEFGYLPSWSDSALARMPDQLGYLVRLSACSTRH